MQREEMLKKAMDLFSEGMAYLHMLNGVDNPPFESLLEIETSEPAFDFASAFHNFYEHYWNHTGRAVARKAYDRKVKEIGKAKKLDYTAVANGLLRHVQADRRRFEGTDAWEWRKNLHPATWLNQERWTDQAPQPRTEPVSREVGYDRL
jgi:hypothetical protein